MTILKPLALVLGLTMCVFMLRHNNVTPGDFLRKTASRVLQESSVSARICDGTDPANSYSDSEKSRADQFKSTIEAFRGGNPLKEFIEDGKSTDDFSEYAIGIIPFAGAWIAFLIITLIGCTTCMVNCCCSYCRCCQNDEGQARCCQKCCGKSTSQSGHKFLTGAAITFSLAVIGTSIAGMILSQGIPKGIDNTSCALTFALETTNVGEEEEDWIGLTDMGTKLGLVLQDFDELATDAQVNDEEEDINNALDALRTELENFFTNADTATEYARPDPEENDDYQPEYIENLGDYEQTGTYLYAIDQEATAKSTGAIAALQNLADKIQQLKNDQTNIKNNLQSAKDTSEELAESVQDLLNSYEDTSEAQDSAISAMGYAVLGIFAPYLLFAALSVVAIILSKKFPSWNKVTHCMWWCTALISILFFLLATILFPTSVVLQEGCEVSQIALEDSEFFDKFTDFAGVGSDVKDLLAFCIHPDDPQSDEAGDLSIYLNIREDLNLFDEIFEALEQGEPYTEGNADSVVIPEQADLITKTKEGLYIDAEVITTDLATLNGYTDNSCEPDVEDTWALNSANCTSGADTIYDGTDNTDGLGEATCIGLHDNYVGKTADDPSARYNGQFGGCSDVGSDSREDYIVAFATNFRDNREDIIDVFEDLETEFPNIEDANEDLETTIYSQTVAFIEIGELTEGIDQQLQGEDGVLENLSCLVLQDSFDIFLDNLCIGFISSTYQTAICVVCAAFFGMFQTLFLFLIAKRTNVQQQKDYKD